MIQPTFRLEIAFHPVGTQAYFAKSQRAET